ncbi:MAG: ATP-binding protein [Bacteroidetes bacterium]|nr:ATP-binding protein [Bacteroidota bacterium]
MFTYKANSINLPNPAKLLDSLRSTGYDNYNALADIIDNSLDADANKVIIDIYQEKGDFKIIIADDGKGMDLHVLDEALKLGSETDKDYQSDLGRFGMGLSTASLSMCRRTEIITKDKSGKLLKSVTDLDWVKESNEFKKYLGEVDNDDIDLFNSYLKNSESGTIVIFSKSDRIQNTNTTVFTNTLKKHVARIFRRFLEAGKVIIINKEKVQPFDPLILNDSNTRVYSDEEYEIKIQKGDKYYEDTIRIKFVIVPNYGYSGNRDKGINYQNQGFYVMRNQRELFAGSNLDGIYTKDAHLNRFRAEIYFSGSLDDLMGVHFTKRSISIDQALHDKIKEYSRGQITEIQKIADSERPKSEKVVSHSNSEKLISKKSKLLVKPPAEEEPKRETDGKKNKKEPDSKDRKRDFVERLRLICKFEERSMEKVGPLYAPSMEGKKVIITWNSDHPFYKLIVERKEDKTFVTALDFLIFSFASAELKSVNDENVSLLEGIRQYMSQNLRVLVD